MSVKVNPKELQNCIVAWSELKLPYETFESFKAGWFGKINQIEDERKKAMSQTLSSMRIVWSKNNNAKFE